MSMPIVGVEHEPDAQPLDEADVHLDRLAREAERRDADEHRAAAEREAVVDRDLVAVGGQLAGDGDAGRSGADDRDALLARRDLGHDVGDAGRLVPLDEEALHGADRERAVDVAAPAGALARGRADVGAHRRDRVRLAGQDVALLEPALGGEVEVAPAVRADGACLLALDVALEPGCVDRLDEELLGLVDGHEADVPFLRVRQGDGELGGATRRPVEIQPWAARASSRPGPTGARPARRRRTVRTLAARRLTRCRTRRAS